MAKIERYIAGPGRTPSGGGVVIPQSSMAGYSAFGNALQSVGQTIDDVDEHFRKARQASLMSSLKIGLARETSDIEIEYDDRQDYDKFSDISDRIGKMRQEYMDKIGHDNEIMELFMPQFEDSAIRLETGVRKLARSKFVDADRAALGNEIDNVLELAGRSGKYEQISGEIRAMGKAAIAGRAASGVIGREDAENAINRFEAQLWDNYFTAQTRSKPIETSEALKDDKLFPGLSRDKRLYWQGIASEAATKKTIEDTAYNLIGSHKNDFNSMYSDLNGMDTLSRFEKSKVQDMIETAETQYNQHLNEIRTEGKKQELENIFGMVNDRNLLGAVKAVENAEYLTEEEKFNKTESLKNWGQRELWSTDPELEAKIIKQIDEGTTTETDIEFNRGMGLSNADTDKLIKRLTEKGKDPVRDSIIKDALSYAKSRWITAFPKADDDTTHFSYIKFQNQIQDELEAMAKDKPLTRAEAAKHVNEYFDLKKTEERNWWPDRHYYEVEDLADKYTEESGIPEDEYTKIEKYLDGKGLSSSRADVEKVYEQNKGKPGYQKLIGSAEKENKTVVRGKIKKDENQDE